jgi:hypothetical protein
MKDLKELQRHLAGHALDRIDASSLADELAETHPVPAIERLRIYRNNTILGLSDALADTFPVVARLVGAAFFAQLAADFVRAHPPRRPALLFYGAEFPGFISCYGSAAGLPYLADVARLEAARRHAFHGADAPPFDPLDLQGIPDEILAEVRFLLHPSHRFVTSSFPVDAIWRSNQPEGTAEIVDLGAGGVNLVVFRPDTEVQMLSVSGAAFAFLMALGADQTVTVAWETALAIDAEFHLIPVLAQLLASRLFVGAALP